MKLLRRGAEAELLEGEYLGSKALVKDRVAKTYRRRELDERIRNARTKQECLLLHKAKAAGIRTPLIYKVDKKGTRFFMEFVEGERLKDVLARENLKVLEEVGEKVARMHASDLVHGDLTTSNIMQTPEGRLVFIDFGLGFDTKKDEDKAVDLVVFKKTFMATHSPFPEGWELIVKGYLRQWPKGKAVVERTREIEKRVRYH